MIESIRKYILDCPYLDEFNAVNINYLINKINSYSVNEGSSYNPVISKDIVGNEKCQYQFTFDAKFRYNEELINNINNSAFFENFSNWLRKNNKEKKFPTINDDNITITSIEAISPGYIFDMSTSEVIYRISCVMEYRRWNK